MDRTPLVRKYMAVGIILLFVGACIISATATPVHQPENRVSHPWGFFGLKSDFEITWDANQTEEPLMPRGPLRWVDLEISFWVIWGIFGRLINYLFKYEPVTIKLSVIDKPEWCVGTISQETLRCIIPPLKENSHQIVHTRLFVHVADNAPAFEICPVTIQTTVEPLRAPFGSITIMQGISKVINVVFTVGYRPLIRVELPHTNIIETPPLVQVELPIGITNFGNGKTTVENEVVSYPDDWIVSIPNQLIVDVYEHKEMNLSIIAPSNFSGENTITVSFTPHSSENYSLFGKTIYETIFAYYNPL